MKKIILVISVLFSPLAQAAGYGPLAKTLNLVQKYIAHSPKKSMYFKAVEKFSNPVRKKPASLYQPWISDACAIRKFRRIIAEDASSNEAMALNEALLSHIEEEIHENAYGDAGEEIRAIYSNLAKSDQDPSSFFRLN